LQGVGNSVDDRLIITSVNRAVNRLLLPSCMIRMVSTHLRSRFEPSKPTEVDPNSKLWLDEVIDRKCVIGVIAMYDRQNVEFDAVLLQ
jgi:hypothetical protein